MPTSHDGVLRDRIAAVNTAGLESDLRAQIETLQKDKAAQAERVSVLESRVEQLMEELRLARAKQFGRSSEKADIDTLPLFDEPPTEPEAPDDTVTVGEHTRVKRGRKPLDPNLERVEIVHDIPDADKHCGCGHDLSKIGEEISERLQGIREQFWVEKHIRPYYGCKHCEGSGDESKPAVRIADPVPSLIPKSIVTPSLLAMIEINKFCNHLPFYRQEEHFARLGIDISRQDMANWHVKVAQKAQPVLDLMDRELLMAKAINMDETPLQVLGEKDRTNTTESRMWLARGGPEGRQVVRYHYRQTRAAVHVRDILKDFTGYLQTDGYEAYDAATAGTGITLVGCMAHARRKFDEAVKASKQSGSAHVAMGYFAKIYAVERDLRERLAKNTMTSDAFVDQRRAQVEPILAAFHAWLLTQVQRVVPSGYLGKAIAYTLGQWNKLIRYLDIAELTPDNNSAERAIKPFVIGRKNWLFAGSPEGAHASEAMYSLIETAKANGLNPETYLVWFFDRLTTATTEADYEKLLPFKDVADITPVSIPLPKRHNL